MGAIYKNIRTIIIITSVLMLYSCASSPRFTSANAKILHNKPAKDKNVITDTNTNNDNYKTFNDAPILETEVGIASYYGYKFNGNPTSNGEIYDMYGLSAAHPTYPEGTIIRVTKLSTGKSLIIRINDRMPKRPDRIIDLSYGTAEKLDMLQEGIAKVKIEVLKWGKGK